MRISELWEYPVKSLAGSFLTEARLAPRGFANDRRWMLVDEHGRFISQREHAHLARWQATVDGDELQLRQLDNEQTLLIPNARATDGPPLEVTVWDDRFEARQVTTVDDTRLSELLGLPCRLVYMAPDSRRPLDPKHATGGEEVSFADGYPYLLANQASLDALAEAVGEPLSMRRFRPNIVLEGAPAFTEDEWTAMTVNNEPFRLVKPCARCVVITIDPETLQKNPRVFATLAQIHGRDKKVLFGMNTCWTGTGDGIIRVGDQITVK